MPALQSQTQHWKTTHDAVNCALLSDGSAERIAEQQEKSLTTGRGCMVPRRRSYCH